MRTVLISCDIPNDIRTITVGPHAELLYVRSLLFVKRMEQDGWLSHGQVRVISHGIPKYNHLAKQLVGVGLWDVATVDRLVGYRIREWRNHVKDRPSSLSSALRDAVIARVGLYCGLCGEPVADRGDVDIDHIPPRALGGDDDLSNLQVAHSRCNRSKGARV